MSIKINKIYNTDLKTGPQCPKLDPAESRKKSRKKVQWKKWSRKKVQRKKWLLIFSATKDNPITYNNIKSNSILSLNIFVKKFYVHWIIIKFNLWTNFIEIIWLDKLLILFKNTSIFHSRGWAPWTPFDFRTCERVYIAPKKTVWIERKNQFFPSVIFPSAFFPDIDSAA